MRDLHITPHQDLVFYRSKIILLGAVFISLVYGSMAFYYFYDNLNTPDTLDGLFFSAVFVVLALVVMWWGLYHLVAKDPLLKINSGGIYTPKTGQLSWNDIQKFELVERSTGRATVYFIVVHLANDKQVTLKTGSYSVNPQQLFSILQQYKTGNGSLRPESIQTDKKDAKTLLYVIPIIIILAVIIFPLLGTTDFVASKVLSTITGKNVYCHISGVSHRGGCYDIPEKATYSTFLPASISSGLAPHNSQAETILFTGIIVLAILMAVGTYSGIGKRILPRFGLNNKYKHTFNAEVYMLSTEEGGRHIPFYNNFEPTISIHGSVVKAQFKILNGLTSVAPGSTATVQVSTENKTEVQPGMNFSITDQGNYIGKGTVTILL